MQIALTREDCTSVQAAITKLIESETEALAVAESMPKGNPDTPLVIRAFIKELEKLHKRFTFK